MEIRDLLIAEMQDQYDAEKQLVKALPKMVKAAANPDLSQAFADHLEETKGHVQRLEEAFEMLGIKARGKTCAAMKGLIAEAQETLAQDMPEALKDSAMICAAQKVEHYEIAGYGTICSWAQALELHDVAELLHQTLDEEKAADEKLTDVNEPILAEAGGSAVGEKDVEESGTPGTRKAAGGKVHAATARRHAS
jgi:ferritin-like metal-binding protein YciE